MHRESSFRINHVITLGRIQIIQANIFILPHILGLSLILNRFITFVIALIHVLFILTGNFINLQSPIPLINIVQYLLMNLIEY